MYSDKDQTNPVGPKTGEHRIMRGGSVINLYKESRVSNRVGGEPNSHFFFVGFRLALKAY
jgi:formylglycine-generating enzyme required for sulfatase activity